MIYMSKNVHDRFVMDVLTYKKRMEHLDNEIRKARDEFRYTKMAKLMAEMEALKQQYYDQKFPVEQAFDTQKSQHAMLEYIVIVTVLCDILSGQLIEMKEYMGKYNVCGGDAYNSACAAVRLCNDVVKKLDSCGSNTQFALSKITEEIESKYMFGMVNDVRQIIGRSIEWKKDF